MADDPASGPVHLRVSADLRAGLEDGTYPDGQQLPTEAELAERYGVSRQTVRRAFQDLVADGLVRRMRGQGTFATPAGSQRQYARTVGSIEDLLQWRESEMELAEEVALRHDTEAADALELEDGVVATLSVRRLHEGQPFALTRISLPPLLATRLVADDAVAPLGSGTVIAAVETVLGEGVVRVQQELTAITAPDELVEALGVIAGAPVLHVRRLYFDAEDRPVELAVTHYNPARYTYRLELRGRR